jgi:hypothetical protein
VYTSDRLRAPGVVSRAYLSPCCPVRCGLTAHRRTDGLTGMGRPAVAVPAGVLVAIAAAALRVSEVAGHGLMLDPISRNAKDGIATPGGNMWFR